MTPPTAIPMIAPVGRFVDEDELLGEAPEELASVEADPVALEVVLDVDLAVTLLPAEVGASVAPPIWVTYSPSGLR
jgi:hypothetical protein